MKTTPRFEAAVKKLYHAFHNNTLHPECCTKCAVGTILNGTTSWKHLSDHHGSIQLNYIGQVHQAFGKRFQGYTPRELLYIEAAFLEGCGYALPLLQHSFQPANPFDKDILFNGLSQVVSVLCKFDALPEAMVDTEKLLSYQKVTISEKHSEKRSPLGRKWAISS